MSNRYHQARDAVLLYLRGAKDEPKANELLEAVYTTIMSGQPTAGITQDRVDRLQFLVDGYPDASDLVIALVDELDAASQRAQAYLEHQKRQQQERRPSLWKPGQP